MVGTRLAAAAAAALCMFVTATMAATPPSAAVAEEVPTGGPVTGKVIANHVNYNKMGLCASECVDDNRVSNEVEGNHLLDVAKDDGAIRSQEDAIPAGTYRVAFAGSTYDNVDSRYGYLRRTVDGRYQVVKHFEDATEFTVVEGEALKLGTLNTRAGWAWNLHDRQRVYGYGGEMTGLRMKFRAIDFPKEGTLIVRTVGCGGKVYRKVYRQSGDFTVRWHDPKASQHYGKAVRGQLILRRDGDLDQVWRFETDWSHVGWDCS